MEELVKENLPLAVGPTFGHATKVELQNKSWTTPGILAKAGCHVSIISDAPVTPLHNLPLYAGMAMKAGMDPYDATASPHHHQCRRTHRCGWPCRFPGSWKDAIW